MTVSRNARSASRGVVPVAAVRAIGGPPEALLQEAVEAGRLWKVLESRRAARRVARRDLAIAIKPDLDIFAAGSPTGTDPALVEALIVTLRRRGFARVTVCDGRNRPDHWLHNRDGMCVPDLVGYRFEAPEGQPYEVVFNGDDHQPVALHGWDEGGALLVNRAWVRADVRISFAKAKTDDEWGYSLALANLVGLIPSDSTASRWSPEDRALNLLRTVPPHFALIDAVQGNHGSSGAREPTPISAETIIASPNCLLADWLAALKMGADPEVSPLNRLAGEMVGLPRDWELVGDAAPWEGWTNPSPTLRAAVRGRARWPALDSLTRAILQPVDRELFPFRDVVIDQLSASVRSQLERVTDPSVRETITSLLARVLDTLASARFALVTNLTKGEVARSVAPLTIDVDRLRTKDFDTTRPIVEAQRRALDGAPPDARGFRIRTVGGHTYFAASRVLPISFEAFTSRVDISAGIRYMNDYLGGSWVVVDADGFGRPQRQAERNVYLPQPNWIGAVGGELIDVEKVERIAYGTDRQDLWWRTIRSPNGSADSDDGLVSFVRTSADQVEVQIFARQRFRLPTAIAALRVENWPAVHRELVADAYAKFFDGTLANLRAAHEGRPYRIGKDLSPPGTETERSELQAVLAGAFALLARTFGWSPASGVTPQPGAKISVEPVFVDEAGFAHFAGQRVPAFVSTSLFNAGHTDDPLTPSVFLKELGRAVGRDLAALGLPEAGGDAAWANGPGTRGTNDPGADWAAAHLGMDPDSGSGGWP
ncbi:MAG: DUF362 domain-containing protein [Gemmatimonas sp.]|nr:DUF362 domain-containing protein [Gemmatimonas sp.]